MLKKTSFFIVFGLLFAGLGAGCDSESPRKPVTAPDAESARVSNVCFELNKLYTKEEATRLLGGNWSGGEDYTGSKEKEVCSYTLVRSGSKNTKDGYDLLTFVASRFSSIQSAESFFNDKQKGFKGKKEMVSAIGNKAFFAYAEDASVFPEAFVMRTGNHLVTIWCSTACTKEQYTSIAKTVADRMPF